MNDKKLHEIGEKLAGIIAEETEQDATSDGFYGYIQFNFADGKYQGFSKMQTNRSK